MVNQVPGAAEASIRDLPPSAIGDSAGFDAMGLLAANKGKPMEGIVEQVRDGSSIRVYLLAEFQFVQVFVAGIQVNYKLSSLFHILKCNKVIDVFFRTTVVSINGKKKHKWKRC